MIILATTITILFPKFLFPQWEQEPLDELFDAFGISLVLFGFLLRIAARGYKAERSREGKKLIIDGPFSMMRNPMYFGTLLIGSGVISVVFEWWVFPIFLLIFLSIYVPQINREERRLLSDFGDGYKEYCKKTPKYFPRISSLFNADFRDHISLKWRWIKKDLPAVICIITLIMAIEVYEDIQLFGRNELITELLELSLIIISWVIIMSLLYEKDLPRKD